MMSNREHCLVGKVVTTFSIAEDKKALKFDLSDGISITAYADGDCCSRSWIENVEDPAVVVGNTILEAADIPLNKEGTWDESEYEFVQYYGFKIRTIRGTCIIDYRNESNGYYGGDLVWPKTDGSQDYYYGGVFGQNVSKEEWKVLASVAT